MKPNRSHDGAHVGSGTTQRHLYLILDDWFRGYSIRSVDLTPVASLQYSCGGEYAKPLPPALLRLEAPRGMPKFFTAAFNNKIFAMHPRVINGMPTRFASKNLVPVFDVLNRSVMFGPRPLENPSLLPPENPSLLNTAIPIYITHGNRLFALGEGMWAVLLPPPFEDPRGDCDRVWSWQVLDPPTSFSCRNVLCYGAYPDGLSIFFCIGAPNARETHVFTFHDAIGVDIDDEGEEYYVPKVYGCWTLHSQVSLPFSGQVYYDGELDSWVGLSSSPGCLGHICSCSELPWTSSPRGGAFRISEAKLFMEASLYGRKAEHIGVKLVHLGGESRGGRFCLVECVSVNHVPPEQVVDVSEEEGEQDVPQCSSNLLIVTSFLVKYDIDGKLKTDKNRHQLCYSLPGGVTQFSREHPTAFWM
ncbi:hypothetical protein ACP4OV_026528 [Aristida adscensionis]